MHLWSLRCGHVQIIQTEALRGIQSYHQLSGSFILPWDLHPLRSPCLAEGRGHVEQTRTSLVAWSRATVYSRPQPTHSLHQQGRTMMPLAATGNRVTLSLQESRPVQQHEASWERNCHEKAVFSCFLRDQNW
jgi:hypothetical protein